MADVPLLMVEDDANVAGTLADRLRGSGFAVTHAMSVAAARAAIAHGSFDIALLDVGLPDGNGFDVARDLRQRSPATALVFLTAYGTPENRIHGLELGADDYVTKPFVFRELLLRVQNALKRANYLKAGAAEIRGSVPIGRAAVDFGAFTATVDGIVHPLTHKECAVLKLLYERSGTAVSRDEILDRAWSADEFPTSRTVDNFILRLRRLVEQDPANPRTIRSIRGVGYLFEANDV
jgi:two-component system, OmpR family, alkaline phosphatase synthesis response regulator PhoP